MSFYINRFKNTDIELAPIHHPMDGEFKMVAFKGFEFPRGSGKVWRYPRTTRTLMDWKPNLITNQGLDHIGRDSGTILGDFHVGGGNTTPTVNDVSMDSEIATTGTVGFAYSTAQTTAPYYGTIRVNGLFQPNFGGGAVNINEIGISPDGGANSIGARALTEDDQGDPATVPVDADEYLECFYRRRNYPAHLNANGTPTDDQANVTIEGVSYTYTIRPMYVTTAGSVISGEQSGWGSGGIYPNTPGIGFVQKAFQYGIGFQDDATLGVVTAGMGGTEQTGGNGPQDNGQSAYTGGTYSRETWYEWGIAQLNDSGGIGGLVLKTRYGAYQLTFNNPVPKVYGQVFTYYHNFSWNRKSI